MNLDLNKEEKDLLLPIIEAMLDNYTTKVSALLELKIAMGQADQSHVDIFKAQRHLMEGLKKKLNDLE